MIPPFYYFEHWRTCRRKQLERAQRLLALPFAYHAPVNDLDRSIISRPIKDLVKDVHDKHARPLDLLRTYGKLAIRAHERTNCLTEIMIVDAENWIEDEVNLKGPLAGIPISLKDSIVVKGYDTSVGYSRNCDQPSLEDGALVKILKKAGCVPYVKTNLPTSLLSFESNNDVWGRCLNPHSTAFSPGGSTGGEAALLACGGRIGIGSDVAGSVRVPAAFSGIYSLRCSTGRWPKMGMKTSMPGQEGVPSVFSPMARTLDDLKYFCRSILGMKCWEEDHTVHPLPWRDIDYARARDAPKFKVGVIQTDGIVDPSPPCTRALNHVAHALQNAGHDCVNIGPPSPFLGLQLASQLLNADGCTTFMSHLRTGERNDGGASQMAFYMRLPRPIKSLYLIYVRYVRRDTLWADLLQNFTEQSTAEQWKLVARREAYRADWHQWWDQHSFDFLLGPVFPTPALPHDSMQDAISSCGYTFLFNLLDYTCGVMPILRVDEDQDLLPDKRAMKLNGVAKGVYNHYDSSRMKGLPVAVQVIGRRLEEEKVLALMERIGDLLSQSGLSYRGLEIGDE